MIRLVLTIIPAFIFLIPLCPLILIEYLIGKFNPDLKTRSSLKMVQIVFKCMLFMAGTNVTVNGRENIPDDEAVLYIANHRSYFDVVIGYTLIKGQCGFISKKEIGSIPFISFWMRNIHCLFLDRDNIRQNLQIILDAIEKVKKGISIFIFPEGTRTPGDEMLEFKEGSFKIAQKSNCKIIPVAIKNTEEVFENHLPFIHRASVSFTFGEPIDPKTLDPTDKKRMGSYVQNIIAGMLAAEPSQIPDK